MSTRVLRACAPALGPALLLVACEPAPPPLEPTYANVAAVFDASCSFDSCHGGRGAGAAMLNFDAANAAGISYDRLLVGVPSCMYDAMPLVDPGDPDNSWLMVKVAGTHAGPMLVFTPDPGWDHGLTPRMDGTLPASVCPLTVRGALSFGTIMPQGSSTGLDAARADLLRRWILAGAPGPDGTTGPRDAGPRDAGAPRIDAGPAADAGDEDAAPASDAGGDDAAAPVDAGEDDGGPADAGEPADAP